MEWSELLDSLVKQFTDHHDEQVLNNTAVQNNEWLHDDKVWLKQQPISDHIEAKTPPKNWDVSADPYRLTQDKMPLAVPGSPSIKNQ